MATWLRHLKLAFGGEIGTPALEQWSCTVRFKANSDDGNTVPTVDFTPEQIDTALGNLNAPLQAWFSSPNAQIGSVARLTWAKLNMIEVNGKQRDVNTHRIDTGIVAGGGGAASVHWFVTMALTERTNVSRGRAHSGRIFPPCIVSTPQAGTPYVGPNVAKDMAAAWANCLNGISTAIHAARGAGDVTKVYPVIGSPADTRIGGGGPLLERVTGVVVDRVGDVQHRRTDSVPRVEGDRTAVAGYA